MCTFYRVSGVLILGLVALFGGSMVSAAPHPSPKPGQLGAFITAGVVRGGEAGKAFSLIGVRHVHNKKTGLERVIFELGNERGEKIKTRPGYFQAHLDPQGGRVILDFAQIAGTSLGDLAIMKKLKGSPNVESVKMTYDPEDHGLTLQLKLKRKVKMKIFELSPKPTGGRLALDLIGG